MLASSRGRLPISTSTFALGSFALVEPLLRTLFLLLEVFPLFALSSDWSLFNGLASSSTCVVWLLVREWNGCRVWTQTVIKADMFYKAWPTFICSCTSSLFPASTAEYGSVRDEEFL